MGFCSVSSLARDHKQKSTKQTRLATRLDRYNQISGPKEGYRASMGLGVPSPQPAISATLGGVLGQRIWRSSHVYPAALRNRVCRIITCSSLDAVHSSRFRVAPPVYNPERDALDFTGRLGRY